MGLSARVPRARPSLARVHRGAGRPEERRVSASGCSHRRRAGQDCPAEEAPPNQSKEPVKHKPTEAEIAKLLADPDPNRRAEGLAAAGYHQMETYYAKVLDAALNGKGIERNAAIYALGFYGRDAQAERRSLTISRRSGVSPICLGSSVGWHGVRSLNRCSMASRTLIQWSAGSSCKPWS